jgi:hypothetical protein
MITKQTMEAVAKLYFKANVSIFSIARRSENLTVGNVAYCIKEMEYKYYPVIISHITDKNSEYTERNKEIGNLYQTGNYSYRNIGKIYGLSGGRIRQIVMKLIRQRYIHPIRNFDVIDEPDLYINIVKEIIIPKINNGETLINLLKEYDISYDILKLWKIDVDEKRRIQEQKAIERQKAIEQHQIEDDLNRKRKLLYEIFHIVTNNSQYGTTESKMINHVSTWYNIPKQTVLELVEEYKVKVVIEDAAKRFEVSCEIMVQWVDKYIELYINKRA